MLLAAGRCSDLSEARTLLEKALQEKKGLAKLKEMIEAQGGDGRVCDDVSLLPKAAHQVPVLAEKDGWVNCMDTMALGYCAQRLGAGRILKTDIIDPGVGFVMNVRLGQQVKKGDCLAVLHLNDMKLADAAGQQIIQAISIEEEPAPLPPVIFTTIAPEDV